MKYTEPFYASAAWRRVRAQVLLRDNYMCCECLRRYRAGEPVRPRPATMVHHIVPYKTAPDRALDMDNLESLCETCHKRIHGELDKPGSAAPPSRGIRIIRI